MMRSMLPFAGILLLASSALAQSESADPGAADSAPADGQPAEAEGAPVEPAQPAEANGEAAATDVAAEAAADATPAEPDTEATADTTPAEPGAEATATPAEPGTEATADATPAEPGTEATADAAPAEPGTEATADATPAEPGAAAAAGATPAEPSAEATAEPTEVAATVEQRAEGIDRGFIYFGFGVGVGASGLSDKSLGDTPLAGTLNLRAGITLFDRLLVGAHGVFLGQFYKWEAQSITGAVLSSLMAEGMYFPVADLPLNVSAGFGWGSAAKLVRVADTRDGDPKVVASSGNGVSWMAGVGWDLTPGPGANFGIQARYEGTQSSGFGVDHGAFLGLWLNFY